MAPSSPLQGRRCASALTAREVKVQEQFKHLRGLRDGSEYVDFAPFGQGCSEEWIEKREGELRVKLPKSYKWWLRNYSGGEVSGMEIFSVYESSNPVGGDIGYISSVNQKNYGFNPDEKLYILQSGHHSAYFDVVSSSTGEYEVIENWDGETFRHINFVEFLIELIKRYE